MTVIQRYRNIRLVELDIRKQPIYEVQKRHRLFFWKWITIDWRLDIELALEYFWDVAQAEHPNKLT